MATALEREISLIPTKVLDSFIGNGYPMDTLSIGYRDKDKEQDKDKEREKSDDYSKTFLTFWEKYPKKIGKGAAFNAWKKAGVSLDVALAAIEKQQTSRQWKRDNGQYIPHPATWLNQQRWEDEVQSEALPESKSY